MVLELFICVSIRLSSVKTCHIVTPQVWNKFENRRCVLRVKRIHVLANCWYDPFYEFQNLGIGKVAPQSFGCGVSFFF